jgi:hypothetical protein
VNRIFEVWWGQQATGKTYQLRRRATALSQRPSIRRVIVCAPVGEWRDIADLVSVSDLDYATQDYHAPRPPVVVSDLDLADHAGLERVARKLTQVGDCAWILDEAALWLPSNWTVETLRTRMPKVFAVLVRGRHIERLVDYQERPTHLIVAAQYAKSVHLIAREQAAVVMVSRPSGAAASDYIRDEAGPEALAGARALSQYQWTAIRGRDPRRG